MKTFKLIILTVLVFFLSNCEVKMQSANASDTAPDFPTYTVDYPLEVTVYTREGIEYRIFHNNNNYSGVFVVNHTKELLEVELLRKALAKHEE